jgi:hypothetical protein
MPDPEVKINRDLIILSFKSAKHYGEPEIIRENPIAFNF